MRRAIAIAAGATLAACGLSLQGTGAGGDDGGSPASDAAVSTESSRPDARAPEDAGPSELDVATDAVRLFDAAPPKDGGGAVDAGLRPIAYAVSNSYFWTFDLIQLTATGAQLPTQTCPTLNEVAVDDHGNVFVTSSDKSTLLQMDPAHVKCKVVGVLPDGGSYPASLAFAPAPALGPGPVLVGFSSGDYVRIDLGDGGVTTLKSDALAGRSCHDIINVGGQGYASISDDGDCQNRDCLWKVDLKSGLLQDQLIGTFPTTSTISGLAQWAGTLYGVSESGVLYAMDPTDPGSANGTSVGNVAFHGAGSSVSAPATP